MWATAALRTSRPPTGPRATLARQWIVWQGFQRTGWPSRIEEKRYDGAVRAASLTVVGAVAAWAGGLRGLGIQRASGSDRCPIACALAGAAARAVAGERVAVSASEATAATAAARAVRR